MQANKRRNYNTINFMIDYFNKLNTIIAGKRDRDGYKQQTVPS